MSRKGFFADVVPGRAAAPPAPSPAPTGAGASPSVKHFGAALGQMRERATRAQEIEKALASGERVVEIDPALIDPSPIPDRLPGANAADAALRETLERAGQQVPVLLRRHPQASGRYLTVYGHRRIAALTALGRAVKAIVVEMSDEDAFVAQGVENNARRDLSFIERAVFAARLAEAGTSQSRIAAALHTAQPNVATMIGLARRLPRDLVAAVGASPAIGRRRWERIDAVLAARSGGKLDKAWRAAAAAPDFPGLDGDARFERVAAALESAAARSDASDAGAPVATELSDSSGAAFATVERRRGGEARIRLLKEDSAATRADGAAFVDWLEARLPGLREAWRRGA